MQGNVDDLSDDHPFFTFQASCYNAQPTTTRNLAYELLKNGAIGTVGATTISHGPGAPMNRLINDAGNAGMAYNFALRLLSEGMTAGEALTDLRRDVNVNNRWWYWKNYLTFNLWGDPSLGIESHALIEDEPPADAYVPPDDLDMGVAFEDADLPVLDATLPDADLPDADLFDAMMPDTDNTVADAAGIENDQVVLDIDAVVADASIGSEDMMPDSDDANISDAGVSMSIDARLTPREDERDAFLSRVDQGRSNHMAGRTGDESTGPTEELGDAVTNVMPSENTDLMDAGLSERTGGMVNEGDPRGRQRDNGGCDVSFGGSTQSSTPIWLLVSLLLLGRRHLGSTRRFQGITSSLPKSA